MPLNRKQSDALGRMLFWPGMILGGVAGAWLTYSGLISEKALNSIFLSRTALLGGGCIVGLLTVRLIVLAVSLRPGAVPRDAEQADARRTPPPLPEERGGDEHCNPD